jgi:hypothetical protein
MVDAEIAEGDVGPITQAIQNALRSPSSGTVHRLQPPVAKSNPQENNGGNESQAGLDLDDHAEVVEVAAPEPRQSRARRTVSRIPNVVAVDMNEEVSLASFAHGKDAKSQHKKYLIAAAWLKEHRAIDAVTDDHIYTCFKSMGWPTNIPDFSQPLRDLKAKHRFFEKTDKGYEINHLGLDFVNKLGAGNGAQ